MPVISERVMEHYSAGILVKRAGSGAQPRPPNDFDPGRQTILAFSDNSFGLQKNKIGTPKGGPWPTGPPLATLLLPLLYVYAMSATSH